MSMMPASIKTFYKNNPWKGRFIISFFILSLILTIARLALPQTIIYSATSWLKQQGIDSSIEAININIFDGTVSLLNAKGSKNDKPLFKVGLIDIHWQWEPLSEKTIDVTKVVLDQFSVNIEQYSDEILIGGVKIPLGRDSSDKIEIPETTKTDTASELKNLESNKIKSGEIKPWAASLGEVVFTNLNVCYLLHTAPHAKTGDDTKFMDYCVTLDEMSWGGTISYATDAALLKTNDLPLSSTGNFKLNGLTVTDNKLNKNLLTSKSNTLSDVVISGLNNIHINKLVMNELSALQRDDKEHRDAIRFHRLIINDIKLGNLDALDIDNITIIKPGLYLVRENINDWEYQQWMPHSSNLRSAAKKTSATSAEVKHSENDKTSFKLAINDITINDSDWCYLQKNTSLYYCLTYEAFNWKGVVNYDTKSSKNGNVSLSIKGDLNLTRPNVHNYSIQRDLLDFKSLTLTQLNIANINTVSIKELRLEKLAALQRSKKQNDYTALFNSLAIDDIKYSTNNLSINTIKLDDLANNISINKNGEWEHNKWLLKISSEDKTATNSSKHEEGASLATEKPFIISLNKLNISSDQKILFTDNSTVPAMHIGLNNLSFDIDSLYTTKPDTNSAFKLSAKTIRHSTIDIEGTVNPFSDKLSFDAIGKLKGFDLRAATPATKKAIGHIIQSGQMDSDLQLRAVEGVLDSNISLSLHHFNIKATNQEDADKLDKKFGMPLNQTLVLLREKDDSIHLDIPITGDVNHPNFEPMDAIIKATSKAATTTLITFYTPYGLAYFGGSVLFDLATALNFEPIKFTPGSAEMPADSKAQLDNLARLLTEKPQIHLTLCGVTSPDDVYALYPELKKQQKEKNDKDIILTKEQLAALNQLAGERQINSKNYLIKESGIEHDRLILCAPEHLTSDEAIPGVKINI